MLKLRIIELRIAQLSPILTKVVSYAVFNLLRLLVTYTLIHTKKSAVV